MAPTAVEFTDKEGNSKIMLVWYYDVDNDPITLDRAVMFSIYDGTTFSEPQTVVTDVATRETLSIAASTEYIVIGYTETLDVVAEPEEGTSGELSYAFTTVHALAYDIQEQSWGTPVSVAANSIFDQGNVTKGMVDIEPAKHGYFVIAWAFNHTAVYKLWSPVDMFLSPVALSKPGEGSMGSLSLASSGDLVSLTWTLAKPEYSGFFYSVMEGGVSFGSPIFVQKETTNLTMDTYSKSAIINLEGGDLFHLRLYNERDVLEEIETNTTKLAASRLMYDVRKFGAELDISAIHLDINNGTISSTISLLNIGTLTLPENGREVRVYTGNVDSLSANTSTLLYSSTTPSLFSGASWTISFLWTPDSSFEGYVWVKVVDPLSGSEKMAKSIALWAPKIVSVTNNPSKLIGNIVIAVEISNVFPVAAGAVVIPVYAFIKNEFNDLLVQAANATLNMPNITAAATTVVTLEFPSSLVKKNLVILAGGSRASGFNVHVSPSVDDTVSVPVTKCADPNLAVIGAKVIDHYVGSVTISVIVKNTSPFPAYNVTLGAYYNASISNEVSLMTVGYVPPLSYVTVSLPLIGYETLGDALFAIYVNPHHSLNEPSYDDNFQIINVKVFPRIKINISPSWIVVNETQGTISFAVRNAGETAPLLNISVHILDVLDSSLNFVGSVEFTNVSNSYCQIGTLTGLAEIFTKNITSSSHIALVIPAFFTGSASNRMVSVDYLDSIRSSQLPNCNFVQDAQAFIYQVPNITVRLADNVVVPLNYTKATPGFSVAVGLVSAPSFVTFNSNDSLLVVPLVSQFPRITNGSPLPMYGIYSYPTTVGLHYNGIFYSTTTFTTFVIVPLVVNMTAVTTDGGRVTVTGYNFGKDASVIRVTGMY